MPAAGFLTSGQNTEGSLGPNSYIDCSVSIYAGLAEDTEMLVKIYLILASRRGNMTTSYHRVLREQD